MKPSAEAIIQAATILGVSTELAEAGLEAAYQIDVESKAPDLIEYKYKVTPLPNGPLENVVYLPMQQPLPPWSEEPKWWVPNPGTSVWADADWGMGKVLCGECHTTKYRVMGGVDHGVSCSQYDDDPNGRAVAEDYHHYTELYPGSYTLKTSLYTPKPF